MGGRRGKMVEKKGGWRKMEKGEGRGSRVKEEGGW